MREKKNNLYNDIVNKKEKLINSMKSIANNNIKENIYSSKSILKILCEENEKLKKEVITNKNSYLRIYAEFENYKKRSINENKIIIKNANKNVITSLLVVIDNLENASFSLSDRIKNSNFDEEINNILINLEKGIILILKQFIDKLKNYGLDTILTYKMIFDPNKHEAIKEYHDKSLECNIIIKEYQKGYMLNKKLLRASKVGVNINNKDIE